MKWTISINQRAAVELGLEVDMIDLAVFDMLKDYTPCAACKKMQDGEKQYFSVPYKKVLSELPLLPIKTSDGLYRRFKKLEQAGILEMHPENAKMAMVWFAWGRNFQALSFDNTPGYKSEGMEQTPGFISDPPRMENRPPSDEYPTYTIPYPIPNNSLSPARASETEPVEAEKEKKNIAAGGGEISAGAAARTIEISDSPKAKTPAQLEDAMKEFYRQWKKEWTDGVCRRSGEWIPDDGKKTTRLVSLLSDFCTHTIKNNGGGDTYGMLNAAFQGWVRNEKHATWKDKSPKTGTANTPATNRPSIRAGS